MDDPRVSILPDLSDMSLEELATTENTVFADVIRQLKAQIESDNPVVAGFQSAI